MTPAAQSVSDEADDAAIDPAHEADALAALIGSRICHDMVNPVGAIANGIELISMGGAEPGGPELQLVTDSVAHASARLKFYRIAFGIAGREAVLGRSETALVVADCFRGGRLAVDWGVAGEVRRAEAKIAFLLLQCIETALPRGGAAHISATCDSWRIEAEGGDHMKLDPGLWALLHGGPLPAKLRPNQVQFALAPRVAAAIGRRLAVETGPGRIAITF
jgi:histidine phosphotransferase ChpT